MQWLSLFLVVVFGGLALVTNDARFMMIKPSLIHFAIGFVMMKRGWIDRYLPPIVHDTLSPAVIVGAGYVWAALMFALGIANLVVAWTCSLETWALYLAIVPIAAKFILFGAQYVVLRTLVVSRRRRNGFASVAAE
jgi:intracellular septation protein A